MFTYIQDVQPCPVPLSQISNWCNSVVAWIFWKLLKPSLFSSGIHTLLNPSTDSISFPWILNSMRFGNEIWEISLMMEGFLLPPPKICDDFHYLIRGEFSVMWYLIQRSFPVVNGSCTQGDNFFIEFLINILIYLGFGILVKDVVFLLHDNNIFR